MARALIVLSAILSGFVVFTFGVTSLNQGYGGRIPGLGMLLGVADFFICGALSRRTRLEPKAVELCEYLLGLRDCIKWAEADRLNYPQSPQGAERTPVDATSPDQVVKLYERLLPYVILFGFDKEWVGVLGRYYEQTGETPEWLGGHDAFSISAFMIGINSITTSAPPTTTISSGGSFSGGGGRDGGGGGGWGVTALLLGWVYVESP